MRLHSWNLSVSIFVEMNKKTKFFHCWIYIPSKFLSNQSRILFLPARLLICANKSALEYFLNKNAVQQLSLIQVILTSVYFWTGGLNYSTNLVTHHVVTNSSGSGCGSTVSASVFYNYYLKESRVTWVCQQKVNTLRGWETLSGPKTWASDHDYGSNWSQGIRLTAESCTAASRITLLAVLAYATAIFLINENLIKLCNDCRKRIK